MRKRASAASLPVNVRRPKLNPGHNASKGMQVDPPPSQQEGTDSLYRIVYLIDISASNPHDAAQQASRIMSDPESLPPILHVIDRLGHSSTIDLAES